MRSRIVHARPLGAVVALALLGVVPLGCGGGGSPGAGATHAQVRINSMLIGLSTTGLQWDSVSAFASHFRTDIATALASGDPYAAAAAVIGNVVADLSVALDAPDPVFVASIYIDGSLANTSPMTTTDVNHDTFFPTFPGGGWSGVPLDADIRIQISVYDEDITDYEPICVADLNTNDVVNALHSGHVDQIDVSSQCQGQLLFVGLSVIGMP